MGAGFGPQRLGGVGLTKEVRVGIDSGRLKNGAPWDDWTFAALLRTAHAVHLQRKTLSLPRKDSTATLVLPISVVTGCPDSTEAEGRPG